MKSKTMLLALLALGAGCATTAARPEPKNAASSSAITTGQPRATDDDVSTTRTTAAEIRAEQPKRPPAPGQAPAPDPEP